ncbi:MAG TPA: TadE/TadG family type IV pilus assembly protein [Caulobacteraceae bacterium]|nr:TadE/TadG family type IV pilus assembly protein [Caulobacteraceae bacterium]
MKRFGKAEDGTSAAEFAMVLPVVLLFVFGLVEFGMLLFTTSQLHWTAEQAARCSSVSTQCKLNGATNGAVTNTTVGNYAKTIYKGLAAASYNYDTDGSCSLAGSNSTNSGHRVTASANFKLNLGVYYKAMPLTANACFP